MDPAMLLLLSSLLQLQQSMEATPATSAAANSSSSAPLMFFTLLSVVIHAAAMYSRDFPEADAPARSALTGPTDDVWDTSTHRAFLHLPPSGGVLDIDSEPLDTQWQHIYGMSYVLFTRLVDELEPHIKGKTFHMAPDAAVAMVLYRLAHGHKVRVMAAEFQMDPWMITRVTNLITKTLATKIYPKYVSIPTGQRLVEIMEGFKEITGLPNVAGVIDCSHVKLHKKPGDQYTAMDYMCRHQFYAVLLQLVCDCNKIFWDVCVKSPGAADDATHLRGSSLYKGLMQGEILVGNHVRPYIVGDWNYPLLSFLLTPFTIDGSGTEGQNLFDASLLRGKSVMEHAIGLLKGRWRILQNLNVSLNHAPQTIVACCVLHNMCMFNGEPEPSPFYDPLENGFPARLLDTEKASNYFGESMRKALVEDLLERNRRKVT